MAEHRGIGRHHVEADFFANAEELRGAFDSTFDNPYESGYRWEYNAVHHLYAHFRALPRSVFPSLLFDAFLDRLHSWCLERLGLVPVFEPKLHLMINGCSLSLHSDFHNGAMGYVYSLTRWDGRKFTGGETLLFRDGIPNYKRHHVHGETLYELIPARFNQLLVFDDRIVHATPRIEGSMDPREGRIALVGHLRATGTRVKGALSAAEARGTIAPCLAALNEKLRAFKDVQGTITYELRISATGSVESLVVLMNSLIVPATGYGASDAVAAVKERIEQALSQLRFSAASDVSRIIVGVLVPIPDQRPLEIAIPHDAPLEVIVSRLAAMLELPPLELRGRWSENEFVVSDPEEGSIRVEADRVHVLFGIPMWVPSQRAKFEADLKAAVAKAVGGA